MASNNPAYNACKNSCSSRQVINRSAFLYSATPAIKELQAEVNNLSQQLTSDRIEIGKDAMATGTTSIAIGKKADASANKSIVINATGSTLESSESNSFYVKPIREDLVSSTIFLKYNELTGEIVSTTAAAPGGAQYLYELDDWRLICKQPNKEL